MDTQPIRGNAKRTENGVSERGATPLTFTAVDGLAFAARKGMLGRMLPKTFVAEDIGPLLELTHLSSDGALPSVDAMLSASDAKTSGFRSALRENQRQWICPSTKRMGFFRTTDSVSDTSISYQFGVAAQKAAIDSGFPRQVACQLVAAIVEMVVSDVVRPPRCRPEARRRTAATRRCGSWGGGRRSWPAHRADKLADRRRSSCKFR